MWRKSEENNFKNIPGSPSSAGPSVQSTATVSQGIKMKGEISGQGDFCMDGTFEGTVHIPGGTFTVGPNGHVTAEIEAREIIICGEVIGGLKAHERIQLLSTAKLTGNMDTRGIMIEDGAVLHSKVAVPQTARQAAAPEKDQTPLPALPETPVLGKGAAAGAAAHRGQVLVSISRGTSDLLIFCDSRQSLFEALSRSSTRRSATELARGTNGSERSREHAENLARLKVYEQNRPRARTQNRSREQSHERS